MTTKHETGEPKSERKAWSIEEWRAMYGLGRNSVYALIASDKLPTIKVGRRRLITVEGDEQFRKNIGAK